MPEMEIKPLPQDIHRLAAYIDGEGCISIRRSYKSGDRHIHLEVK